MAQKLLVTPISSGTGLTTICVGLLRALDEIGVRVRFIKPIAQLHPTDDGPERSTHLVHLTMGYMPPKPILLRDAQHLISTGRQDLLLENIVAMTEEVSKDADIVIVESLVPDKDESFLANLNVEIYKALNAKVILTAAKTGHSLETLSERIRLTADMFGGTRNKNVIGCIINRLDAPKEPLLRMRAANNLGDNQLHSDIDELKTLSLFNSDFPILGAIPWSMVLMAPRTLEIQRELKAQIINQGELDTRRILHLSLCARTVQNMVSVLKPGTLIITPGDRDDILLAAAMATMNGVPLAGILFTGEQLPNKNIMTLCQQAFDAGLPLLRTDLDSFTTTMRLMQANIEIPLDDSERIEASLAQVAQHVNSQYIRDNCKIETTRHMSPAAFRYRLVENAKAAKKRIILPEGNELRTIKAAIICTERKIAECVLLGNPVEIKQIADANGIDLEQTGIEILDPEKVRHHYVTPMVALRQHKGLTAPMAEAMLEDNIVLGTMMLALDEVDGLVAGAINTTANIIRPAMQLIKTSPDAKIVSSVFFMCLPDQVLVYGDCAVNPDPSAAGLADIAIQSADSANAFGIDPRVAMISYSTGVSGKGADVDKVREATEIVRSLREELIIDGPLQYDAAAIESVAKSKAPNSPVAGNATVFIFPDLNTGNTTYKAVQRSANVISIGPMLQGLRKPVNDLSRGALVEDIVFTIALTAIQAKQAQEKALKSQ